MKYSIVQYSHLIFLDYFFIYIATMAVDFGTASETIYEILAPVWVETSFLLFFALGFALFPSKCGSKKARKGQTDERTRLLYKQLDTDVAAGHSCAALKIWRTAKSLGPAPIETLKNVVQLLLESAPDSLVEELIEHIGTHRSSLSNGKTATTVLDLVARGGRADLLDDLAREFKRTLSIRFTSQMYEVLLGGHASAGDDSRVLELCAEMQTQHQKLTPRGFSLTIKGFLKNGMVDAALRQIQHMHREGFFVPTFAVAQLFRTACQSDRCAEIFEAAAKTLEIPQDAIGAVLEDCHKRSDLELALRVEQVARANNIPLPLSGYDALLKVCVLHANGHASQVFKDMQKEGHRVTEGLCGGLLARCADTKFLRFAEEVANFARGQEGMSIAVYSALMKVYAYCGLYDKACDLYPEICAQGLEPDSMMYGCLMKFAVECGRTDLSRELFAKAPQLDIQNYMSLIRAAGRDKDIERAFAMLEKLKGSGVSVDIAAYNCVLDACVSVGDLKRGRLLMAEMRTVANLDIITYNTLLKGYCSKGDLKGAKEVFLEMKHAGLEPNDISYNCVINAAVSRENFQEAWSTIETMERSGVKVDQFTISIMMKALKKVKDPKDIKRALDLLDRSGIDVCSDEVLLNTVLETCTRHRQFDRLQSIILSFSTAKLRPSVHTYGSLIKACSSLHRMEQCYEFWNNMVHKCGMQPNEIVLGCMLDALVCNGQVEESVKLLNEWKTTITPNTVMYSTIIKGFANKRMAARALDMWEEMCKLGLTFNTVVFNALIDSQARVGAMDKVTMLVESMGPKGCVPDGITYSTIVKGYCTKGDLDKAFEVFRSLQGNGMAMDSVIYNTVMDGCTRHNRMDLADLVWEDMVKNNIKPSNFTLGILVKMWGRRRQINKAFEVFEELPRRHGFRPNSQARTCLMCACLTNGCHERAIRVFADLKEIDQGADVKAHASLLSGLLRLGQVEKAVTLVEEAYGLAEKSSGQKVKRSLPVGQNFESEALEQLVNALTERQLMNSIGLPLLERLRAAKVPISGRLFSSSFRNN